jgi:hypothetical protein
VHLHLPAQQASNQHNARGTNERMNEQLSIKISTAASHKEPANHPTLRLLRCADPIGQCQSRTKRQAGFCHWTAVPGSRTLPIQAIREPRAPGQSGRGADCRRGARGDQAGR